MLYAQVLVCLPNCPFYRSIVKFIMNHDSTFSRNISLFTEITFLFSFFQYVLLLIQENKFREINYLHLLGDTFQQLSRTISLFSVSTYFPFSTLLQKSCSRNLQKDYVNSTYSIITLFTHLAIVSEIGILYLLERANDLYTYVFFSKV